MHAQQLGDYADTLTTPTPTPLTFCEPRIHIETRGHSRFADLTDWRAQLHLTNADDPTIVVLAGYIDFLVARLGNGSIPAMLAATPGRGEAASDPAHFAQLFDGQELDGDIEEQFDDALCIHTVLLIQDAFIDPAFRGHRLGPWTVADVVHRMADVTNGLVAMFPHLCDLVVPTVYDDMDELYDEAYSYWQRHLNLEPLGDGFLGQATAFTHLENARAALEDARSAFVAIDVGEFELRRRNNDPDLWPLVAGGAR
jgi:hypothetical protein